VETNRPVDPSEKDKHSSFLKGKYNRRERKLYHIVNHLDYRLGKAAELISKSNFTSGDTYWNAPRNRGSYLEKLMSLSSGQQDPQITNI
jgi:hypothetical protein